MDQAPILEGPLLWLYSIQSNNEQQSMCCRTVLPQKPPVPQLLIQFPVFYKTCQFITLFTLTSLTPSHIISLAHPPAFCSHIYSSLYNITIKFHMFNALQTQWWHTKLRDKQSENLTNQGIPQFNAPISNWNKQQIMKFKPQSSPTLS